MKPYYQDELVTLYHGDCREILPLRADVLITSPPYLDQRGYGKDRDAWELVVPPAISAARINTTLVNLGLIHHNGEVVEYWNELIRAMRFSGFALFGWYVWDQMSGMPGHFGGRFSPSHEFVFHFRINPVSLTKFVRCSDAGRGGSSTGTRSYDGTVKLRRPTTVQERKIPDSVIRIGREAHRSGFEAAHPARFPEALASFLMAGFDGIVLDPFVGSGTTLMAAKRLGRKAIGIEIEERYCEIAAKRCAQGSLAEMFQ